MPERVIRADGLELATEVFGDPADPPVLLIMGVMASFLWWPEGFCAGLAARGRFVIRYDNRDTGRSTVYPQGQPGYTLDDLADDAIRILDGYGLPRAHLVGMSLGGIIAQLAALRHPSRVVTLTVISSTAVGGVGDLARAESEGGADPAAPATPDWTDRAWVIDQMVADSRALAGVDRPFDEAAIRAFVGRDFDRARHFGSATNHTLVSGGEEWAGRTGEIRAPLLVIHGTADPVFPFAHAEALAGMVANSRLVRIEGGGHELHPQDWERMLGAIAAQTAGHDPLA